MQCKQEELKILDFGIERIDIKVTYEILKPNSNNEINDYGFPMPSHQETFIAIINIEPSIDLTINYKEAIIAEIEAYEWKDSELL